MDAWDDNAFERHKQLLSQIDLSFDDVLVPSILNILKEFPNHQSFRVLDVGCGTGVLAKKLSSQVANVIGIDPSFKSIELAREYTKAEPNIDLIVSSIETINTERLGEFDFIVANMVLQAVEAFPAAVQIMSNLLQDNGNIYISIPHPCFWASYKKELQNSDYLYSKLSRHSISFTISKDRNPLPSSVPYYHRPLEYYSDVFFKSDLVISKLKEPIPDVKVMKKYPQKWDFPRFLIFLLKKFRRNQ